TQIQCSQLQSRRAQIHQQIDKELQMRTGAENLYRATSNNQVRETVALELSYVNSNLQLLKEELEELSGGVDPGRHGSEAVTVPMIPLGLKETKELDWSTPLKELISVHFGEDGASYEAEIRELEALRQAMRTPSRNESGLELLTAYYNQLCFLDARFLTPASSLGLFFHWYDSLTGVPAQQRALAFEKGSVLFNIGALHTQIGARQDRSCAEGARRAMEAFQRAAGAFSLLRENFSHAPSPDMSAASLCALEQLMMAQAQECVFEGLSPPYAELDREDDFCEAAEAPDIQPKTHQKPEARMPRLSQGKGPDIFHRLGPLSVFSAKNRWRLVGPVHLTRGEGSQAAIRAAGLKEGDYIVSVNGQPCRWWRHAEVVTELKAAGEAGASLQVVSLLPSSRLPSLGDRRPILLGPRGLLRSQREHGCKTPASTWASPRPLLNWSRKAQQGKTGGCPQPCAPVKPAPPSSSKHPGWP
uniref:Rhophilin Rho GTPase binding protein 1 n=1 Tax=Nomascus leucogenys TaxID=61853 RepID=G1QM23_NOMLE